jgi:hypothetical protein
MLLYFMNYSCPSPCSFLFTSVHIHSHLFTYVHILSHVHLCSHRFGSDIHSIPFTSLHIPSYHFTSVYIHSHLFTPIDICSYPFCYSLARLGMCLLHKLDYCRSDFGSLASTCSRSSGNILVSDWNDFKI